MSKSTIDEKELICQVFIDTVKSYFEESTEKAAQTELPYILNDKKHLLSDCTGLIGISGNKKGVIYITGPSQMFRDLVLLNTSTAEPSQDDILDMTGEVANTVAGNARKVFGAEFMISVPALFEGKPDNFRTPTDLPIYVIPINWNEHQSHLVIAIQ